MQKCEFILSVSFTLIRGGVAVQGLLVKHIKENLLIPDSGFPRTPPKLEGLGERNLDPPSSNT